MYSHQHHYLQQQPGSAPGTFTTVLRIDAADHMDTSNCNPGSYSVVLPEPLRGVSKIKLSALDVVQSPIFTVIRTSPWQTSGTDALHQMAERIAANIGSDPYKSTYAATITNTDGTVLLQVFDVVTRTEVGDDSVSYMTIDTFVCTGRAATQSYTNWQITADGETAAFDMTSDTGSPVDSKVFCTMRPQRMILHLDLNSRNRRGRVMTPRVHCTQWESYRVYRPGDIVRDGSTTNYYKCLQKHLSMVLPHDISLGYFQSFAPTTSLAHNSFYSTGAISSIARPSFPNPSDGSFCVLAFDNDYQSHETELPMCPVEWDANADMVQKITVNWNSVLSYPNVSAYIWPYVMGTTVADLGPNDPTYSFVRQYASPAFELEITHT